MHWVDTYLKSKNKLHPVLVTLFESAPTFLGGSLFKCSVWIKVDDENVRP